ncbi:Tat (twin-arginine translocation) pathway signal sequence domain protein [Marinomonas sp. MED121]|uniref:DUF2271 domain-containing protein n=1 Tax=Marinomonas sp. MED121 TaxID=314277 RepID=UPI0000690122|nr:DUF2271 domain-containing protein [Marinomonas sp. MED121]EAQ65793.1 Tat (twin-arginine translocation) pathway signal sequence domain protein [Marinomonas sp. MED121]
MKPIQRLIVLLAVFGLSHSAFATSLDMQVTMKSYNGDGAYMAIYLMDANGRLVQTLAVEGRKKKYQKHLRDWKRANRSLKFDGKTGASLHKKRSRNFLVTIDDKYIDSNYFIHIDTSVEDKRDVPSDVIVPLTQQGIGQAISGKGYVKSFVYRF